MNFGIKTVVLGLMMGLVASKPSPGQTTFKVGGIGGAVMLPDDRTLVVSITLEGTLAFYDTVDDKELKRVELEFQPTAMAIRGSTLFVATKGSAIVHRLDVSTAKELGEMKLGGDPVLALACHPKEGYVYAANSDAEILAIDPKTGKAFRTEAKGQFLAVDPAGGKFLYTGVQKQMQKQLLIRQGPGGSARLSVQTSNTRCTLLKYAIKGHELTLVGANDNAARNGRAIGVSSDGKRVGVAGGGGWMSKTDPHVNYVVAVFDTADLQSLIGQVETGPYPGGIAFHPKENLGAAFRSGSPAEVLIFNAKSFARKGAFAVSKGGESAFLGFGANGTKVIYILLAGVHNKNESVITFYPLDDLNKAKTASDGADDASETVPKKKVNRVTRPRAR